MICPDGMEGIGKYDKIRKGIAADWDLTQTEVSFMWGRCVDIKAWEDGLFQAVVSYKIDNGKARVILPKADYELDIKEIMELPAPPRFAYGEQVSPRNHPDITGVITEIRWHSNRNCCFYTIRVNGKKKSKRYFDDDLISAV